MKSHRLSLLKWILPPSFLYLLQSRSYFAQGMDVKKSIRGNTYFKAAYSGRRCFILATGPSVASQDLAGLAGEICFSAGEFYLHPDAPRIKPLFHVEAPNHVPYDFKLLRSVLGNIKKLYPHSPHLFLGNNGYSFSYSKLYAISPLAFGNNFTFLNYHIAPQLNEFNYLKSTIWDISRTLFAARTVVYSAIQIAAYMGFSEIYLLGCDHDYLIRFLNDSFQDAHFYDDSLSVLSDSLADSSSYLKSFNLEDWFGEYYFRWKEYRLMLTCLALNGQRIYNATDGGMLDVFPRANLLDLI